MSNWGLTERELLVAASLLRDVDVAAWRAGGDPPPSVADGTARRAVDGELAALARLGARAVTPVDAEWPPELPRKGVLRVRGEIPKGPRLAVVGARRADPYGRELAGRVAAAAARRGVPVVSGGAFGVDAAAHRAALDAGGATVAVLGSGLAHPSPREHLRLFDAAAAHGAVVSPFPTLQPPDKWTFPKRNAWIAGLSAAVVVVQAGSTSGALHTASAARKLGRPVWAAPGPVDSPLHAGCHALIRKGAALLSGDAAWTESLPGESEFTGVASPPEVPQHPEPGIGAVLWRAAGVEPLPLTRLADLAGLAIEEAAPLATLLELEGWLRCWPGGRYARSAPREKAQNQG
jgi:DNA processing protein